MCGPNVQLSAPHPHAAHTIDTRAQRHPTHVDRAWLASSVIKGTRTRSAGTPRPIHFRLNQSSGHGSCKLIDSNTGNAVESCSIADLDCSPVCVCSEDFAGSSCELSSEALAAQQQIREQLIASLSTMSATARSSPEMVATWAASLGAVAAVPAELSLAALTSTKTLPAPFSLGLQLLTSQVRV